MNFGIYEAVGRAHSVLALTVRVLLVLSLLGAAACVAAWRCG